MGFTKSTSPAGMESRYFFPLFIKPKNDNNLIVLYIEPFCSQVCFGSKLVISVLVKVYKENESRHETIRRKEAMIKLI